MNKPVLFFTILMMAFTVSARKLTVTSSSDHVSTPVSGMLRYFVNNAQDDDTILFAVSTVSLLEQIDITDFNGIKLTIDGGVNQVTIDAGRNDRCINISAYSYASDITIKNLKLINGYVESDYGWGGAMYVFISSSTGLVTVENCIMKDNETNSTSDGQGGALRCNGGTYKNCAFLNNKVVGSTNILGGGGVNAVSGTFINCIFSGNYSGSYAGGIYATNETILYNCTIAKNFCGSLNKGGGIFSEDANTITNCIIYDNKSDGVDNNLINYLDEATVSYCALESAHSLVGTNNNIGLSATPFKYGGFPDSLTLVSGSSCIDAGTSSGITLLDSDFAGNVRVHNSVVDMGAYEYGAVSSTKDSKEKISVSVFPNPSKGVFYIDGLTETTQATIYDEKGNIVAENKITGSSIDLGALQDGLYILKLDSKKGTGQTKILLQR